MDLFNEFFLHLLSLRVWQILEAFRLLLERIVKAFFCRDTLLAPFSLLNEDLQLETGKVG